MRKGFTFFVLLFLAVAIVPSIYANPGIVPVTSFTTPAMPGGVPDGWSLEKKAGTPALKMEKDGNMFYLRLISSESSFGLRKEARVDVRKFPVLSWRWRVDKLPRGGDVRKSSLDDQALQVYVAFKESGFLGLNTPIIGYIWDNDAPRGWTGRSPQTGGDKLRYIVLRNRTDSVGQWYTERRNVYEDYKKLFPEVKGGEPQSPTTGLQIYINTQHTKSQAEGAIGDIYFSSEPSDIALAGAREVPSEKIAKISAYKRPKISSLGSGKKKPVASCININIGFDTDVTDVEEKDRYQLQTIADYLSGNAGAKMRITGHTDNVGAGEYNLALSAKRAENVKKYLVEEFNVDPQRLDVHGAGVADPIADNDTPEGRQQNRRVEIRDCPEQQ